MGQNNLEIVRSEWWNLALLNAPSYLACGIRAKIKKQNRKAPARPQSQSQSQNSDAEQVEVATTTGAAAIYVRVEGLLEEHMMFTMWRDLTRPDYKILCSVWCHYLWSKSDHKFRKDLIHLCCPVTEDLFTSSSMTEKVKLATSLDWSEKINASNQCGEGYKATKEDFPLYQFKKKF